jgi:catechol 2,3-dioxygenase-like lactoylglutathione lyase family enzyme
MAAPKAFNHVGVTVTDIEEATRWYQRVLGCHVIMPPIDAYEDGGHFAQIIADIFGPGFKRMRMAHLGTAEGIGIELFQFYRPKSTRRKRNFDYAHTGIFHLCVTDPDIEGLVRSIAKSGGRQRSKIWKLWPDKPYKVCYCEDPWGNIVEVSSHGYTQTWANFSEPHHPG